VSAGSNSECFSSNRLSKIAHFQSIAAANLFDPGSVEKLARKCAGGGARGFRDNMRWSGQQAVWHDTAAKRKVATYLHTPPLTLKRA
jgi:hypothetical protein